MITGGIFGEVLNWPEYKDLCEQDIFPEEGEHTNCFMCDRFPKCKRFNAKPIPSGLKSPLQKLIEAFKREKKRKYDDDVIAGIRAYLETRRLR